MDAVLVLHGPNLNLLGQREPEIYGNATLEQINTRLVKYALELAIDLQIVQSNHEGALIDALQDANTWAKGVVFNPGGFAHTSVALRDTISAITIPVVEVHLSNVFSRSEFRHYSYVSAVCKGTIVGFGWMSYAFALSALRELYLEPCGK